MERTYEDYNTKCLYFKDNLENYQLLGTPEKVEYNESLVFEPTVDITINNPQNIKQYMLENLKNKKQYEKTNLSETKITLSLPERYIINENATILFWKNGEKTIVKRCADDEFNPRLAFLTAFWQHYCGMSKNKANKYLANLQVEEVKEKEKKEEKKQIDPERMEEETEFKVGDMVEVTEEFDYSKKGWIGKITEVVNQNTIKVKYNDDNEWWINGSRLKLIKEGK